MLAMMQQSATESDAVELTAEEQADLMAHHSLLLDPRDESPAIAPQWRLELQAHVRQTLEKYFAERQFVSPAPNYVTRSVSEGGRFEKH